MTRLDHIQCSEDARRAARRRLPRMLFDFIDGGAGEERASRRNREALDRIELLPRVLVNVEARRIACDLLGRRWDLPFGIAPMGMCDLAWPGADRAFGDAARDYSIPHCLSTAASTSLERCRARAGDNAWFQLYVSAPETGRDLVRRARDAGYEHLVLTVDTPVLSRRRRELRRGFRTPFRIGPSQLLDFALHPRWSLATLMHGVPRFANNRPDRGGSSRAFDRSRSRGAVDWAFLDALRDLWPHRLIVKGVLSPDDAAGIRDAGADAVYVSNHGGRQLDSAPAAIDSLPGIRHAVGPDYPLLFDSGLRDGEDIVKAFALGASYVMLGRPFLYAAGAGGRAGVYRIIELLAEEVGVALAQIGRTDIGALDERVLARGGADRSSAVGPREPPGQVRPERVLPSSSRATVS